MSYKRRERSSTKRIDFDRQEVPIPRTTPDEERAVIYWWCVTQLTGFALYRIFLFVYSCLDGTSNGHKSLRAFMEEGGMSRQIQYFNPTSYDESKKLMSDPYQLFLDISFINKAFRNALRGNADQYRLVSAIGNEIRRFNDERNLLSHNRLPSSANKENFISSLDALRGRMSSLCALASQLNSKRSYELDELMSEVSSEMDLLKERQSQLCSNCKQSLKGSSNKTRLYLPRI